MIKYFTESKYYKSQNLAPAICSKIPFLNNRLMTPKDLSGDPLEGRDLLLCIYSSLNYLHRDGKDHSYAIHIHESIWTRVFMTVWQIGFLVLDFFLKWSIFPQLCWYFYFEWSEYLLSRNTWHHTQVWMVLWCPAYHPWLLWMCANYRCTLAERPLFAS